MSIFAGMAVAVPFLILPVIRWLALPLRRILPTGGRLAADSLLSNPLRTAVTAIALTIGLSVVVVNSSMSASFVGTIEDQGDRAFARDFTVQAQDSPSKMQSAADAKKEVSDEINRTFNMINAIVIIAIIVSLIGVINTLESKTAPGNY
jgi:putative ABC transport system permease protein